MINQKPTLEDLVGFYKQLLETLDLKVDREGKIIIKGERERPLTINGLPVVLPTNENIRSAVEIINGVPTPVKIIFNPLDEDAIKGENESLKKLRQIVELKLNGVFYQIGETLFNVMYNTEKEINHIEIIRFATLLNRYKATGLKNPIDEKLITNWIKLYKEILSSHYDTHIYMKIFNKRGGKINNIKYNRINSLGFPFLEELVELKPNKEKFLDIKLRTKDKHAYQSLFEYVFKADIEELLEGLKFGSLNKIAPGFHALMLVYDFVYNRMSPIIKALAELDLEDREIEYLSLGKLPIDINNLGDFIDALEPVIKRVPKESNLTQASINEPVSTQTPTTTSNIQKPTSSTSNSPWASIKAKVGQVNTYAPTAATRPTGSPLGSFGSGNAYTNSATPAPRPIGGFGNPAPRPIGGVARPAAPRPIGGFGGMRNPTNPQPVQQGYQNPFLRGR